MAGFLVPVSVWPFEYFLQDNNWYNYIRRILCWIHLHLEINNAI